MPRSEGGGQQGKITSPPFLHEFSRVKERIFVHVFLFEIRKYQANLFRVHTAQTYWRERRGRMEQEEEEEEVVLREVLDLLSPALLPSASLGRKGGRKEGFGSLYESLSQSFLKQSSFDAPPFPPFLAAQRRRKGRDLKAEFSKEKNFSSRTSFPSFLYSIPNNFPTTARNLNCTPLPLPYKWKLLQLLQVARSQTILGFPAITH